MKKLLTILCLVLLVSCSPPPEVPSNQLVERQGVTYQVNLRETLYRNLG